jgi:hypothetical protein
MIFVFGSNLAGIHGAGAAAYAVRKYGAVYGVGRGMTGNAYALPTKDQNIVTRSLAEIDADVALFCKFAAENQQLQFLLTPVGCGLAGLKRSQISPMFRKHGLTSNVVLSHSWITDGDTP